MTSEAGEVWHQSLPWLEWFGERAPVGQQRFSESSFESFWRLEVTKDKIYQSWWKEQILIHESLSNEKTPET